EAVAVTQGILEVVEQGRHQIASASSRPRSSSMPSAQRDARSISPSTDWSQRAGPKIRGPGMPGPSGPLHGPLGWDPRAGGAERRVVTHTLRHPVVEGAKRFRRPRQEPAARVTPRPAFDLHYGDQSLGDSPEEVGEQAAGGGGGRGLALGVARRLGPVG